ncbi:protocatechuate 3,4-dioxygenase [Gloeothece verrucosa]|uniref:Intradiol ring-cleavage dioxygenase n=1 Tax=Gloeothece verrucosa (strain PCC 7822) TaxID=497965 RepID=E0UAQ3_GLOV7|nr:protocatechuate 3,4-dioxygenase [Gloeothece verrucosa]ADN13905.1 intradiol ring-cleavage dioxygenase [Gloeothece verrucosa PCC 7822]
MAVKNRRIFLKQTSLLGMGLITAPLSLTKGKCSLTPPQTQGPFYPLQFPLDQNNNLTVIDGHKKAAFGETIVIRGCVLTEDCQPLRARVEIWQACASGRYNHDYDPNPAPIDPNFQYWGYATTDDQGKYSFITIKPGGYPVTDDWVRPPHIHFKITAPKLPPLITQLYFSEEEKLNQKDRILQRVPPHQRNLVMMDLKADDSLKVRNGQFNIILNQTPELV